MAGKRDSEKLKLVKSIHPRRPDRDFFRIELDEQQLKELAKPRPFLPTCDKACTDVITT